MFISLILASSLASRVFHVAPTGSDLNSGTDLARAFRTVQHAVDTSRAGDTCLVHAGTYREGVRLSVDGEANRPVRIVAATNEVVTMSGADPLNDWLSLGSGVFRAKLPNRTLSSYSADQVFQGERMMEVARWPKNQGTLVAPTDARVVSARDAGTDRIELKVTPIWNEPDQRWIGARIWLNLSHLGSNWGQDGQAQTGEVVATSRSNGTITVAGIDKRSWNSGTYQPDQPWGIGPGTEFHLFAPLAKGVLATGGPSQLLGPGEWWSDGTYLHAKPTSGSPDKVTMKIREFALDLSGRHDIVVEGISLFGTSLTTDLEAAKRSTTVAPARNLTLRKLRGRYLSHFEEHTGQFQMQWLQKSGVIISGSGILLEGCEFEYTAGAAVCLIGVRNRLLGNTIRYANYSASEAGCLETGRTYDPALTVSLDHEIGYNTIEESPQQGINIRALMNSDPTRPGLARIHHNIIRKVMTRCYDSAAIDQYGTDAKMVRIDHNVIQDMVGSLRIGIYTDFGFNYLIDHNLITNVDRPIQINHSSNEHCGVRVEWNTAISSENGPGILNGAGDMSPDSTSLYNLSSKSAYLGKNALERGNLPITATMFVNPQRSDYRPSKPLSAGAFEFGKPAWRAGAAAYKSGN